jgi:uncharacterized membrane protein YdbT with pleckstrin-like domain
MIRLDPGEQLLFAARRHPLPALGGSVAGAVATLLLAALITALGFETVSPLLGSLFALLATTGFAIAYLRYRRDIVVVTDRRLVHRSGLLSIRSSETATERVGDVTVHSNPIGRLLGYGDIEVLADADLGIDRLRDVRDPDGCAAALRSARTRT